MEALKTELLQPKTGLTPSDIGASAAESARLDLKKLNRVTVTVALGTGTGTTLDFSLKQHDAAAAGNSKALTSTLPYYYAADVDAAMTRVDAGGALDADGNLDTAAGIVEVPVHLDDMDADNGFHWASLEIAASGTARIVSMVYHCDTKNKPAYEIEL